MHKSHFLIIFIALTIYGVLAFHQITLPGLHQDEAQEAGLMGMQLHHGYPPLLFRDTGFVVANRAFPVMVQDYIGALNVYLAWFAFNLGGVSVVSLRTMTILTGMLTLIMAYGAAYQFGGRKLAALTILLLAVHPTFIFWTRQGVLVTSYTQTLALAAFWLLVRWWQGGKAWTLILAGFLMGVGLWGKLLFLWFMVAVGVAWLAVNLPHLYLWLGKGATLRTTIKTPWWTLILAIVAGLIGLYPLLFYNQKSGGTYDSIFNNLDQSYYGVDNSNVGENLRTRFSQAPVVYASGHLGELGGLYPNPVGRVWLYLGLFGCALGAYFHRHKQGVYFFMLIFLNVMIAQSSFTNTNLWYTHFALVLPFMVLTVALGVLAWLDLLQPYLTPRFAQVFMTGIVLIVMGYEVLTVARYHQALAETGGLTTYSDAIYRLAEDLEHNDPTTPIIAMDWGIGPAVIFLTDNQIIPNEAFGYSWQADDGLAGRLAPYLALDESLYIFHVPSQTIFPRQADFIHLAEAQGREPVLERVILDRQGYPYFELWRTRPISTSLRNSS